MKDMESESWNLGDVNEEVMVEAILMTQMTQGIDVGKKIMQKDFIGNGTKRIRETVEKK